VRVTDWATARVPPVKTCEAACQAVVSRAEVARGQPLQRRAMSSWWGLSALHEVGCLHSSKRSRDRTCLALHG